MRPFTLAVATFLSATTAFGQDWSGPYAGLSYGTTNGEQDTGAAEFPLSGSGFGLFGGYNWQSGNLVYGGEVAWSDAVSLDAFPAITYGKRLDLKGRFGYATGRTMAYGILGWSRAEYVNGAFEDDIDGWSFGLGVDVKLTDRVFGGIEAMRRDLDHSSPGVSTKIDTIALRVGMNF